MHWAPGNVASLVAQLVKNLPAMQETWVIPGSGRSPGEGNGNPRQYSCLGNPMDRAVCRATIHGVTGIWHYLATKPLQDTGQSAFNSCRISTVIACSIFTHLRCTVAQRGWVTFLKSQLGRGRAILSFFKKSLLFIIILAAPRRILVPWPRMEPTPPPWKLRTFTTGQPGKSRAFLSALWLPSLYS